jgi:hypothetical protein
MSQLFLCRGVISSECEKSCGDHGLLGSLPDFSRLWRVYPELVEWVEMTCDGRDTTRALDLPLVLSLYTPSQVRIASFNP